MTYVREVTQTDVFVYISSLSQSAYFLGLFQLVSPLSKQFNVFNAYILLLHVFSKRVMLTRVRVHILPTLYSQQEARDQGQSRGKPNVTDSLCRKPN